MSKHLRTPEARAAHKAKMAQKKADRALPGGPSYTRSNKGWRRWSEPQVAKPKRIAKTITSITPTGTRARA